MTARTFVGHQRGHPLATTEDINLAIDKRHNQWASGLSVTAEI